MYLRATAKINLCLDVLRRRPDGYHDVRMIMQMTGMYDRLLLTPRIGHPGISLETNLYYIPCDENNLAVRAAKMLMDEFGVGDGLSIKLEKFIPVAAGLAGGSSDAAMTMVGVNSIFHLGLTREQLMERGRKIGADVPFCILGGTALSEGTGELLTPLPPMPEARILLCKPNISVSTRDVYGGLVLTPETVHPDVDGMIGAIRSGSVENMTAPDLMKNVLETVTAARYPVIREIEDVMKENGALNAIMSGSGPTVFGIFTDRDRAEACRNLLRRKYPASRTFLTWPKRSGGIGTNDSGQP